MANTCPKKSWSTNAKAHAHMQASTSLDELSFHTLGELKRRAKVVCPATIIEYYAIHQRILSLSVPLFCHLSIFPRASLCICLCMCCGFEHPKVLGATAEQLSAADDDDSPKAVLIDLIKSLCAALEGMKLSALKARLRSLGVDDDTISELDDEDSPKAAAIKLIRTKAADAMSSHKQAGWQQAGDFLSGVI